MHVNADILLLDEVVATGDASFVQKARRQLEVIATDSSILVLASHSNKVLREICNKGLLLQHGKIQAFGPLDDVIEAYKSKIGMRPLGSKRIDAKAPESMASGTGAAPVVQRKPAVLLINDTGMLPNPGCRAVRKAYKLLFNKHISGTAITASIPVNYWIEHFRAFAVTGKNAIQQEADSFPVAADTVADIDIERWESTRRELANKDQDLHAALEASDLVVLNGEGSIHHNSVRALALLALAKTALEKGKKVFLLNATIQQIMPQLLHEVLSRIEVVHVREMASKKFLAQLGIQSIVTADLAFMAMEGELAPTVRLLDASNYVLVTAGVTANEQALTKLFECVDEIELRPAYLSIGDGGEAEASKAICSKYKIPWIDAGSLGLKEMIGFLRQFPIAISGRHHINIFLMRAGVPFLPLPSNTWKIEETLNLVGYPVQPIRAYFILIYFQRYAMCIKTEKAYQ